MNRVEFLEILKDYLDKDFREDEVNDILRDYEEYFVNGTIEGKSDMEIIESLGSPKYIANEIISQIKEDVSSKTKKDILRDAFENLKFKIKKTNYKIKNYISNKLTPDINGKGNSLSKKCIKIVLVFLSALLAMPACVFVGLMLSFLGIIVSFLAAYVLVLPFIVKFVNLIPHTGAFSIFVSMVFIGIMIILCQIFVILFKYGKKVFKNYIHWLKTRGIYFNALKKKEKLEKEIIDNNEESNINESIDFRKGDDMDE